MHQLGLLSKLLVGAGLGLEMLCRFAMSASVYHREAWLC